MEDARSLSDSNYVKSRTGQLETKYCGRTHKRTQAELDETNRQIDRKTDRWTDRPTRCKWVP